MLLSTLIFQTHAEVSSYPKITAFCGMKISVLTITLMTSLFFPAMFRFVHVNHSSLEVKLWMCDFKLPLEVGENCALLGYYAVSSRNFLPVFLDNLSVPSN